jgi:two-component system, cell cycle response regulator
MMSIPPPSIRLSEPPMADDGVPLVLLAAPSPASRNALERVCAQEQMNAIALGKVQHLVPYAKDIAPDLVILDATAPDIDPIAICRSLRAVSELAQLGIMVVTQERADSTWIAAVLRAGADDYCPLDAWCHAELCERLRLQWQHKRNRSLIERMQKEHERLRKRAKTDSLTGALGRAALTATMQKRFSERREFAVLFADIDRFKGVNDQYGHQVGDVVLTEVAQTLSKICGPLDACGRYGGEEFLLILGDVTHNRAMEMAEQLRIAVRSKSFEHVGGPPRVTISFGVAIFNPEISDETSHSILHRADVALYRAKTEGRDRVVLSSPIVSGELRIPTAEELARSPESVRSPPVQIASFRKK